MKHSIIFKLGILYVSLAVALFFLLNTFGVTTTKNRLLDEKQTALYEEAQFISKEYLGLYYQNQMSEEELRQQLATLASFSNTQIWLVNRDGIVLMDSQNSMVSFQKINLFELDPDFLGKSYQRNTVLGNLLAEPMLSVIFPVTRGLTVRGYLVIHSSMEEITNRSIRYTDIINICLLFSLLILFLVFLYLYFLMIRPLKLNILAARQFSSGNFDFHVKLKRQDEYSDLLDTIQFMAYQLKNLEEYQKNFIANVSHDFRSPLTSIKGYAQAMKDGTIPYEIQEKYLDIIVFEAERLTKLTSSLLELNRFDQNGTILNLVNFDINAMIKQTAAAFEGICTKKRIVLKLQFDSPETFVTGDVGKIQQVLYNLIDNAIKFSHPDSSILISTVQEKDKAFISVKDSGIGIPADSLLKIWDRFYKTDASRGKDKKGIGLGLSITREIINAHKENITVTSTEGVGTTFTFSLKLPEEWEEET